MLHAADICGNIYLFVLVITSRAQLSRVLSVTVTLQLLKPLAHLWVAQLAVLLVQGCFNS